MNATKDFGTIVEPLFDSIGNPNIISHKLFDEYKIAKSFRQPTGLCFDIENFDDELRISFSFDAKLFLVDPLMDNIVFTGVQSMIGDPIILGAKSNVSYEMLALEVDTLKTVKSEDLSDCSNMSFNSCILDLIANDLLDNCLPPWITWNQDYLIKNKTCQNLPRFSEEKEYLWYKLCADIVDGYLPNFFIPCHRKCINFNYSMKKISFKSNFPHFHTLQIHFIDLVRVNKESLQYGYFDMLVEIGSSLGLWLGLSAADLVATTFQSYEKIRNLWDKFLIPK